jgi:DNA polymerase-1
MKTDYFMTTDVLVVADFLQGATVVAFDFETAPLAAWQDDGTAALDPHRGEIVGVSLAAAPTVDDISGGKAIYIPLGHHDPDGVSLNAAAAAVLTLLRQRVFENPAVTKIAHNLGFEAKFLLARGITLVPPVYDTMAGAMLIYKEEGHFRRLADAGLKTLARDWFGLTLPGFVEVVGVGSFADLDPRDPATIDYACHDADLALRLYQLENDWFQANLPAHQPLINTIESPVALFTARMEHRGFWVDGPGLMAAAAAAASQLAQYLSNLETMGRRPVRVGKNAATNDLKAYLFADLGLPVLKQTDTGKASVDAEAILGLRDYCRDHAPEQLAYLEAITAYRGLAKLHKTYLLGLLSKINPVTGAIHTQFFQLGAETGRLVYPGPEYAGGLSDWRRYPRGDDGGGLSDQSG